MWIQLLTHYRVPMPNGKNEFRVPGDLIEIKNKSRCRELISTGKAVPVSLDKEGADVGVLVVGSSVPSWARALSDRIVCGDFGIPFQVTVIVDASIKPRREELGMALAQLRAGHWDLAVPFLDWKKTAAEIGPADERMRTGDVIRTLWCPVLDTRLMIIKNTPPSSALMLAFSRERDGSVNRDLAFLRAVYLVKPNLWALQPTLVVKRRR